MTIFIIVVWIICAIFASYIAKEKNRDAASWFFIGLLFGIFGLIGIAAVPPLAKKAQSAPVQYVKSNPEEIKADNRQAFIILGVIFFLIALITVVVYLTKWKGL